jgi:hypothetical protein
MDLQTYQHRLGLTLSGKGVGCYRFESAFTLLMIYLGLRSVNI